MNRFKMQQMLEGIKAELKDATGKLEGMYGDTNSTIEMRTEQAKLVKDLEERFDGVKAQLERHDSQGAEKVKGLVGKEPADTLINAKAELIRSTMENRKMNPQMAALIDNDATGGNKFLPKTVANEILTEPFVKNPLRTKSTFTAITNLEVPKLNFSLDDDEFIQDGQTAKELTATGSNVVFGRNKFKVFCDVSETTLLGTNTALVATIENGLQSGLAKKEKVVAFNQNATAEPYKHMSFYSKTGSVYDIKAIEANDMYVAITSALADLEDDYLDNASVAMRRTDYIDMIKTLANGAEALFGRKPEEVLGFPVFFCDKAVVPVIGDFSYSHFNYDINMLYERDKNIKTGMDSFVLTAWIDHQIKLKSAFRLAVVTPAVTRSAK